ncbi:hypothetical protein NDU88_001210 [Pleurodeles waltl]|uniref:Uncharacterized protein n=1 Tax=Pleurodeles waltl TaxID=8319 RepID=A0AAV7L8T4_PLEWA|nr:hypothetical protein NDU88_001210 [Pleurodeles waltl]
MVVDNLDPLIVRTRLDFAKWSHLNLYRWGRVQVVRMATLPGYTFVLGMLPLNGTLSTLGIIDAEVHTFVWGTSRLRLASAKLMACRSCRGLRLSLVKHYALALQLSKLMFLLPETLDPPQWVTKEPIYRAEQPQP